MKKGSLSIGYDFSSESTGIKKDSSGLIAWPDSLGYDCTVVAPYHLTDKIARYMAAIQNGEAPYGVSPKFEESDVQNVTGLRRSYLPGVIDSKAG